MIWVIALSILSELALPIISNIGNDWGVYSVIAELRILTWILISLILARNSNLLLRSVILWFLICQVWTCIVFYLNVLDIEVLLPVPVEIFIGCFVLFWLIFRPYGIPNNAIPVTEMDIQKTYAIVSIPSPLYIYNVLRGLLGFPTSTILIYSGGYIYGYFGKLPYYQRKKVTKLPILSENKYAIEIHLPQVVVQNILNPLIGTHYSFRNNCTSILNPLWKEYKIKMLFNNYIPGLVSIYLLRKGGKRNE